jgi:prepilin-type N-terminal cleavage/methylation domain-containing protein/prepilin-type processing-associated H-X9-DG protein
MKTKAFTMIELMVVIAVIGILAGLLMPTLVKAREKGRQTQCKSNLKELHTAVMAYTANGGNFPYATTHQTFDVSGQVWVERVGWVGPRAFMPPGLSGNTDMWDEGAYKGTTCITNGRLYSYVADTRIYLCPTFAMAFAKVKPTATPVRSYVMNWSLNDASIYSLRDGSRRMLFTELNVAKTFEGSPVTPCTMFEAISAGFPSFSSAVYKMYSYFPSDGAMMTNGATAPETVAAYHNGKGNAVFADGHIESLYYSNTVDICNGNW